MRWRRFEVTYSGGRRMIVKAKSRHNLEKRMSPDQRRTVKIKELA